MHRRSLSLITLLLIVSATPLFAFQYEEQSFDRVARDAKYVVRANVVDTWSAWDDAHQVIYTYATLRVSRYFGEITGPDTLVVREVGGLVDGYKQEAIGFPEIRRGENVVLFLSEWDGSTDLRIHAYNQGKYLVRHRTRDFTEVLVEDPMKQGDERLSPARRLEADAAAEEAAFTIEEFAEMVNAARAGDDRPRAARRQ